MLAESYLNDLGFTLEQARAFINSNIAQPDVIFGTASQYGVTTRMLSEISSYPENIVDEYFAHANLDNQLLDVCLLTNSDLGSLESFIAFNQKDGILSNASLRERVKPVIDASYDYDGTFGPVKSFQSSDSIYSSGELGVARIDDVPATSSNLESLFYGSLINMFSALDQSELDQIKAFPNREKPDEFQAMLITSLESPVSNPWSDEKLASLVGGGAIDILDEYWTNSLFGILDHSYLGLATV